MGMLIEKMRIFSMSIGSWILHEEALTHASACVPVAAVDGTVLCRTSQAGAASYTYFKARLCFELRISIYIMAVSVRPQLYTASSIRGTCVLQIHIHMYQLWFSPQADLSRSAGRGGLPVRCTVLIDVRIFEISKSFKFNSPQAGEHARGFLGDDGHIREMGLIGIGSGVTMRSTPSGQAY